MRKKWLKWGVFVFLTICMFLLWHYSAWGAEATPAHTSAWYKWPLILFCFAFIIGIIAPMTGVGGGVLFVPVSTALFPFNVDFVRGAGLVVALTSALSSAPTYIKKNLANFRITIPILMISSLSSIIGGILGLWISNAFPQGKYYITTALGLVLFLIFVVMVTSKKVEFPEVKEMDSISKKLRLGGAWFEPSLNKVVRYKATRFLWGLLGFVGAGFIAGMFGLGAGWANVPVLNLVMGLPLKVAIATSMVIITVNDAAAAWIYLAKGAVLPIIVVPSVLGVTIGARIGARIAHKAKPTFLKYLVLGILLLTAVMDVVKGLKGLGII